MTDHIKRDNSNVVSLNPERTAAMQTSIALTRMPAALHSLRDKFRITIQGLLNHFFNAVDDAMFDLADKAASNHEQNLYFDTMRDIRLRRRLIEAEFFSNIDGIFGQIVDPQDRNLATGVGFSSDELSVVQNDELEEMVACDAMVHRANESYAQHLQALGLRIDHLVPIKVYQKNNPVGPEVICQSFVNACKSLQVDVKARLVLFKLFDNFVMKKLDALYEQLNASLIEFNVLPALKLEHLRSPSPSQKKSPNNANSTRSSEEENHSLDQGEVLSTLRALLGNSGVTYSQGGRVSQHNNANHSEVSSEELLQFLSRAQQQFSPVVLDDLMHNSASSSSNLHRVSRDNIHNLLDQHNGHHRINSVDDDIIDLVGMMFEFILDDRNLAVPMKVLIGRLQIPLIKVAIVDKNFFNRGGHPARRLLNEMAAACLGWQEPPADKLDKDNLYKTIHTIVSQVITDFDQDVDLFHKLLVDLRTFLEKDQRRAQMLEQRIIDAEDGKAKTLQARMAVDAALLTWVTHRNLPADVIDFYQGTWANVLFLHAVKNGVDSKDWRNALNLANRMGESLIKPITTTDDRQSLLSEVPKVLKGMREELIAASLDTVETNQSIKVIEGLFIARLKTKISPVLESSSDNKNTPKNVDIVNVVSAPAVVLVDNKLPADDKISDVNIPVLDQVVSNPAVVEQSIDVDVMNVSNLTAQTSNSSLTTESLINVNEVDVSPSTSDIKEVNSQHLVLVTNLTQGTWFEVIGVNGENYRCRLAAIIKSIGKYIFVNRSGMKVAEETKESLAQALADKRMIILDDGMLFDRALESVIASLRDRRNTAN